MESSASPVRVLVVDDDEDVRASLRRVLGRAGMDVVDTQSQKEGLAIASDDQSVDVALFDIHMPGITGIEMLETVKKRRPGLEIIIMTGYATVDTAIAALKAGAYDYLMKPFENIQRVITAVEHASERRRLSERARILELRLEEELEHKTYEDIVGMSSRMREVFGVVEAVAATRATVLVLGESGTGKELVARAIHRRSERAKKPFLAINCGALTETVLESELFGHEKGAFTGATASRRGIFEAADGGTVLLDEVGDLTPATQVRLLRVLQEGEVRRIGSDVATKVDLRVVAATHVDLEAAVADGRFRQDLFYRLNVIAVRVPALRERSEDIPLLAQHFVDRVAKKMGKAVSRVGAEALAVMVAYQWPGNVRELANAVERAVILAPGGEVAPTDLPPTVKPSPHAVVPVAAAPVAAPAPLDDDAREILPYMAAKKVAVSAFEKSYLTAVLQAHGGNLSAAARASGMDRTNFRRLAREYGVDVESTRST
ncbi:MAG TPA: sigma-54 dependent transcriptional regulator [Myxococcota bacterium]|jgi:two-component system response regulator HydG